MKKYSPAQRIAVDIMKEPIMYEQIRHQLNRLAIVSKTETVNHTNATRSEFQAEIDKITDTIRPWIVDGELEEARQSATDVAFALWAFRHEYTDELMLWRGVDVLHNIPKLIDRLDKIVALKPVESDADARKYRTLVNSLQRSIQGMKWQIEEAMDDWSATIFTLRLIDLRKANPGEFLT